MNFRYIIPLFITGSFIYIYFRLIFFLSPKRLVRLFILFGLILFFCLIILNFCLKHQGVSGTGVTLIVWTANTGLAFLSFILTSLVIRDFLLLSLWLLKKSRKKISPLPSRRAFLSGSANLALAGFAGLLTGTGFLFAKKMPEVKKTCLPVKNLAKGLDGFTIAQITDLHLSPTCRRPFIEAIVEKVNSLKPDMIVFTGDLADGTVKVLGKDADPLKDLEAPFGKYYVTGNHEYYYNVHEWTEKVKTLGFNLLINSNMILNVKGAALLIAGVTDFRGGGFVKAHKSDPKKAVQSELPADLKILLAHQPKSVFGASDAGFDIQISGHTHGGQFFPWQFAVGLDQPYLAGLYRHENMLIYVSRGTGYWGPPVRLGAPSEITLLALENSD